MIEIRMVLDPKTNKMTLSAPSDPILAARMLSRALSTVLNDKPALTIPAAPEPVIGTPKLAVAP